MNKLITSIFAVASTVAVAHSAVLVGLDPLSDNGGADGWSGVTVLDTPIAGSGQITDWAFHADDDARAATIAASNVGVHIAFSCGFSASARAIVASINVTGDSDLSRIRADSSVAGK